MAILHLLVDSAAPEVEETAATPLHYNSQETPAQIILEAAAAAEVPVQALQVALVAKAS
jgi:hypothetical protein